MKNSGAEAPSAKTKKNGRRPNEPSPAVIADSVSRVQYPSEDGPPSFIYGGGLPPSGATYPPASGEQPLTAGIHGLATRGTYCRSTLLPPRCALTAPFHPYPCGRSFSVTLPCPHEHQVVSLRAALCCPDFPPPAKQAATERVRTAKIGHKLRNSKRCTLRRATTGRFRD